MKKTVLYLATALLFGIGTIAVSCGSDDTDTRPATEPVFPEAVNATIPAGGQYTLTFEADRDWTVSIPSSGDAAKWFWMLDGSQEARVLRGTAGTATVVLATLEEENFTSNPSCEVTLTLQDKRGNDHSKVIATVTIGKLDRAIAVYACQLDEFGDFAYNPDSESGLSYLYESTPATGLELVWPEGRSEFSLPILVESNFDWSFRGALPAWINDLSISGGKGGKGGTKTEIRLTGNRMRYPLDGATATLNLGTADETVPVEITIPACRNILIKDFAAEAKFNHKGEVYNSGTSSYTEGVAHGEITATDGLMLYVFAEKTQWGSTWLSDDPEDIAWIELSLADWNPENGVVQSRRLEVGAQLNLGSARKGYVLALPAAVAAEVEESWMLTDGDVIKPEYEAYIVTTVNQTANPGPISPSADDATLADAGAMFTKYTNDDWQFGAIKWEFDTPFIYNLTYNATWGNDGWNLVFDTPYSSFKRFETDEDFNDFTELTDNDADWLTYSDPWKTVYMTPSIPEQQEVKNGLIAFYDEAGGLVAVIHCVFDKNATPGGDEAFKVEFVYPDYAPQYGATLEPVTEGHDLYWNYYGDWISQGIPVYQLTYASESASSMATLQVSPYGSTMVMPYQEEDTSWISYDWMNDDGTQLTIYMDKSKITKDNTDEYGNAMFQFLDSQWAVKAVVICTAAY